MQIHTVSFRQICNKEPQLVSYIKPAFIIHINMYSPLCDNVMLLYQFSFCQETIRENKWKNWTHLPFVSDLSIFFSWFCQLDWNIYQEQWTTLFWILYLFFSPSCESQGANTRKRGRLSHMLRLIYLKVFFRAQTLDAWILLVCVWRIRILEFFVGFCFFFFSLRVLLFFSAE